MIIKVGDEYLDFTGDIYIERSWKLFEDISKTTGDYSYQCQAYSTSKNRRLLQIVDVNQSGNKLFKKINAEVQNDSGNTLYTGFIRVENVDKKVISFSFFSGNNNWISNIDSNLSDIDFSEFDVENTFANVQSSWTNDTGIVFPLFDKGELRDRLYRVLVHNNTNFNTNNDFYPYLFVKDIIKGIFKYHNLKIEGEILNNTTYNELVITSALKNQKEKLASATSKTGVSVIQTISSGSFTKINFYDDIPGYSDGTDDLWDNVLARYTAKKNMIVNLELLLNVNISSSTQRYTLEIRKNGVSFYDVDYYFIGQVTNATTSLSVGDYIEVYLKPFSSSTNVLPKTYLNITPSVFTDIYYSDYLPDISSLQFIKNIFNLFNIVTNYDNYTKTITLNIFNKILEKESIDLSNYIDLSEDPKHDFIDFVSDYGKKNIFSYKESSNEIVQKYNKDNVVQFGSGQMIVDNDFIQESKSLVSMDFTAAYNYINRCTGASIIETNYIQENLSDEKSINSVTDDGGQAKFNFTAPPPESITTGTIVRITNSDLIYQGNAVVESEVIGSFKLIGIQYQGAITSGSFKIVTYESVENNDVTLAIYKKNALLSDILAFSNITIVYDSPANTIQVSNIGYIFFSRDNQPELNINSERYSLDFGDGGYQIGLIENYYQSANRLINNPIKTFFNMLLPYPVFMKLTNLKPIYITSEFGVGQYYLNKISGYKDSVTPCILELIKITK